jgi:hypothetical protein
MLGGALQRWQPFAGATLLSIKRGVGAGNIAVPRVIAISPVSTRCAEVWSNDASTAGGYRVPLFKVHQQSTNNQAELVLLGYYISNSYPDLQLWNQKCFKSYLSRCFFQS